jgi:hypothetical protein
MLLTSSFLLFAYTPSQVVFMRTIASISVSANLVSGIIEGQQACQSIDTNPTWKHLIMCTGQLPSFKEVFEDRELVRNEYVGEITARGIPPCPASD